MAHFLGEDVVSDLLLITDVPRLGKVFSRLADDLRLQLRVASNLEKGAEEIVADKPAMIFVQTHLSGFSADILLKHLKKQLGRRRSRFVLLSPPDQISDDVRKLYHDHVDITLDDQPLFEALREMLETARAGKGKKESTEPALAPEPAQPSGEESAESLQKSLENPLPASEIPDPAAVPAVIDPSVELSLEEQGVVYSPRPQLSVYSEFTSSFDSAVSSMPSAEPLEEAETPHSASWNHEYPETIEAEPVGNRSKKAMMLLWGMALLAVVVGITVWQHRSPLPKTVAVVPQPVVPAGQTPATPAAPAMPTAKSPATEPDARLSDKAVLSAIAENRGDKAAGVPATARLKTLPEFIPRTGADKNYSAANPGWELYKGRVTEFKVYREGEFIKAIQVIDRGGQGVPESFMKGVLGQLTKAPTFVLSGSEKKDGYEIQRGQIAENLKIVYYRDADGGRLRAFVVTWQ